MLPRMKLGELRNARDRTQSFLDRDNVALNFFARQAVIQFNELQHTQEPYLGRGFSIMKEKIGLFFHIMDMSANEVQNSNGP